MYCEEPTVNLKCILLTIVLSVGYWWLPKKNLIILGAILYFTYISLAWYDYLYTCQRNMGPTYLSLFYWWIKPPESKQIQQYKEWCQPIKTKVMIVDVFLLLIVIVGIFWYKDLLYTDLKQLCSNLSGFFK